MSVAVKGVLPEELILANAPPVDQVEIDTTVTSSSTPTTPPVPPTSQGSSVATGTIVLPGTMTPPPSNPKPNVP